MIDRTITKQMQARLGRGRVLVLYGPRRVGKTTIARHLLEQVPKADQLYLNCDELATRAALEPTSLASLESVIGSAQRIVIDEAQRVPNIGLTLKILIDAHPKLDIIATGSSSFELSNRVKEPLTGRSYEFLLMPLSVGEIQQYYGYSQPQVTTLFDRLLQYGSYPDIVLANEADVASELQAIAEKYVYKDSLELVEIRQRQLLPRLLEALALQVGSEVSYHELAGLLGVKLETIERYITLLEAAFIIYRLPALSGSRRRQLSTRKRKVYFYDLGIRNALIHQLQPLRLRADGGALWENFCMNERIKWLVAEENSVQRYYWRGVSGEVDLVESNHENWTAFEFKYSPKKVRPPAQFSATYPTASFTVIDRTNFAQLYSAQVTS